MSAQAQETRSEALDAAIEELHELRGKMDAAKKRIDEAVEDDDLETLKTEFDQAADAFDDQDAEVERIRTNETAEKRRQAAIDRNPRHAAVARGELRAESVYRPDKHRIHDVIEDMLSGTASARERMVANDREQRDLFREKHGVEMRDVGTGAFAGLTVPQYLTDEFVPYARAGSPLFNMLPKFQLPSQGMTVNIGRGTTGTAVAAQASENSGVQETDFDDTLLTVNIRQYAGQNDISRQAAARSAQAVEVIFRDLLADWFTKVDSAMINADGTSGTILGIRSTSGIVAVTYTDASPTVPELYPKLADAIQQIAGGVFKGASAILMNPKRWGWITASLDSSNRPLAVVNSNGPFNALAVGEAPSYGQVVGIMQGLPVVTDGNIPQNLGAGTEDVIIPLRTEELVAWVNGDGTPLQLTFEQSNAPQSFRLAVWGEVAFTAGRYPLASGVISGTGLAAATF